MTDDELCASSIAAAEAVGLAVMGVRRLYFEGFSRSRLAAHVAQIADLMESVCKEDSLPRLAGALGSLSGVSQHYWAARARAEWGGTRWVHPLALDHGRPDPESSATPDVRCATALAEALRVLSERLVATAQDLSYEVVQLELATQAYLTNAPEVLRVLEDLAASSERYAAASEILRASR